MSGRRRTGWGWHISERVDEAQALYDEGDLERCLDVALDGLRARPDDVALLRLAGRCRLELGLAGADEVLRRAVALDPADVETALDLAHAAAAAGQAGEAVDVLTAAADAAPDDARVLAALVAVCRAAGRLEPARRQAEALAARRPDDVGALLDLAELSLAVEDPVAAADAFLRLRAVDRDEGHERFACHGAVEALARAGQWRRALDLAIEATRLDRHQLTTDLLAYVTAQLFGPGERPAPEWADLEPALARQRAEHRRLHAEALVS